MIDDPHHSKAEPPEVLRPGSGRDRPEAAGLEADARRRIGRELRLLYASVLDRPLPERFSRLIDDLAAHDRNTEGS